MSKETQDFQDFLLAKMNQRAPRSAEWGTYEISRSNKKILSKIKYVLTTGIDSFDHVAGGFPFGRVAEVYGLESCGKTAMAIRTASRARSGCISEVIRQEDGTLTYRQLDPDEYEVAVLYIDNEGSLDDDNKLTVDGKPLDILTARCDTVEGVFKMCDDFISGAEMKKEMEEAKAAKSSKPAKLQFLVIIVDTIASTSSREELALAWGKRDFPRVPAEISKGFNRLVRRLNVSNACMICTNQVRTKFSGGSAPMARGSQSFQYQSLGGFALRFYATHRIFMQAQTSKYKLLPDSKFPAGLAISFHTVKNRLRPPLRDGRMVLLFDQKLGGFNNVFSILENLVLTGFVEIGSKEKGTDFVCKFSKNDITPETFGAKARTSLDEDDDAPVPRRGSKKDPGFKYRSEWPKFYEEHRTDIEKLWAAAIDYTFRTRGLDGIVIDDADIEPDAEDVDD